MQKKTLLLPNQTPQKVPSGCFGPLPNDTVGLILGRSSLTKGVLVLTGVIDADYTGEITVLMSSNTPYKFLKKEIA